MSEVATIYPIVCQLTGKASSLSVNIIKLTQNGCLVNSLDQTMNVNDQFKAQFVLPVKKILIETDAVVYKTYDEFKGAHGLVKPGHHVNELLFKSQSPETRKQLFNFLAYVHAQQV